MEKILIIAGSDSGGGAGIQADIKTANAHKTYSSTVITCLTAQNTQKVTAIYNPQIEFLAKQLEAVFEDINFNAIKIGMLGKQEIIKTVGRILKEKAKNIPIILDPVMVATSGDVLLEKEAIKELKNLCILSKIITPNIDEAEILANIKIKNIADMKLAAQIIKKFGCQSILIKGGHLDFNDGKIYSVLLDEKNDFTLISNKRIGKKNIHGTGCTLASALACNIAKKQNLKKAAQKANSYVGKAIKSAIKIGKGSLVLKHF